MALTWCSDVGETGREDPLCRKLSVGGPWEVLLHKSIKVLPSWMEDAHLFKQGIYVLAIMLGMFKSIQLVISLYICMQSIKKGSKVLVFYGDMILLLYPTLFPRRSHTMSFPYSFHFTQRGRMFTFWRGQTRGKKKTCQTLSLFRAWSLCRRCICIFNKEEQVRAWIYTLHSLYTEKVKAIIWMI